MGSVQRLISAWCVAALASGCAFDVAVPPQVDVVCSAEAPACPTGFTCRVELGRCVPPSDDRDAPTFAEASVSPAEVRAGDVVTVRFRVSEPLLAEPRVRVAFDRGGTATPQRADASDAPFTYRYAVQASDPNGSARVLVEVVDRAGNAGVLEQALTFRVDSQPPRANVAGLALVADPTSVQQRPTRLGAQAAAVVSVSFDEPTRGDVELSADPAWLSVTRSDAGTGVVFELRAVDAGAAVEGPVALRVRAKDLVGNQSDQVLEVRPALLVDLRAPPAIADAVWERAPGGTPDQPQPVGRVWGTAEPGNVVRAVDTAGAELRRAIAGPDGGFALELPSTTTQAPLLEQVDSAANSSPSSTPSKTRLVLTPRAGAGGQVTGVGAVGGGLQRDDGRALSGDALGAQDGRLVEQRGEDSWVKVSSDAELPLGCALTFDEARAQLLSFGGGQTSLIADFLMGAAGVLRAVARPVPARLGAGFAMDRARDVAVLFGGSTDNDVWEFDGAAWRVVEGGPADPASRRFHALASAPGGVLLLGGRAPLNLGGGVPRGDAWLRRGLAWERLDAGELPLASVAAAYEHRSDRVLIVAQATGGAPETWWWDGATFTRQPDAGAPTSADGPLVIDPATSTAYLLANARDGGAHAWSFDGAGWTFLRDLPTAPAPGSAAWNPVRGELVFCTAPGGTPTRATYAFRPPTTLGVTTSPRARPTVRPSSASSTDPSGQVTITGGHPQNSFAILGDRWTWTVDAGWTVALDAGHPRRGHSQISLPDGGVLVIGGNAFPPDGGITFINDATVVGWLGGAWITVFDGGGTAAQSPSSRSGTSFATYGGAGYVLSETVLWRLTPELGWQRGVANPSLPTGSFRLNAVTLAQPDDPFFVVVGGTRGATPLEDNLYDLRVEADGGLTWNGEFAAPEALKRQGASVVWDPRRLEHLVFGGTAVAGSFRNDVAAVRVQRDDAGVLVPSAQDDAGVQALALDVSDPEGDGEPSGRLQGTWWWHPTEQRPWLWGGRTGVNVGLEDLWAFQRDDRRPAVLLRFPSDAALDEHGQTEVSVALTVGASGFTDEGAPRTGAELLVWQDGRWLPIAQSSSPAAAPSLLQATFTVPLHRLLGPKRTLGLAVAARGGNGPSRARVVVDHVAVTLEQAR